METGKPQFNLLRSFKINSKDIRWLKLDKVPYLDENGEICGVIVFALDITESKQAEKEIKHSRELLRYLCQRMENVREEERTRIAREVHDELGQVLTSLKLELSVLDKKIRKTTPENGERMKIMLELIDDTVRTVKRISTELRPPILDVC